MNIKKKFIKLVGLMQSKTSKSSLVNEFYDMSMPSHQNAINIFKGEWSSRFPDELNLEAGPIPLFNDERIAWFIKECDISNKDLLELGPLEGGHSYMLERAGAKSIVAIEANTKAYLKCLITKEIVGLQKTKFYCGDFIQYLRHSDCRFEVAIACGVLYHMIDPVELLYLLSKSTKSFIFLWTHYYDEEWVKKFSNSERFSGKFKKKFMGMEINYYQQNYLLNKSNSIGFCGGGFQHSYWMERQQILQVLNRVGFSNQLIGFDEYNHPNGPSFAVIAQRTE